MLQKVVKKETEFAGKKLVIETGELALQANMAVKVSYGDTVVLATAVSGGINPDLDFFPLKVDYLEKLYASGTIKSSRFVKRDGRPNDDAVVIRRLIDHAVRPLFPQDEGFMDEVQVAMYVMSLDEDADPVFTSMVAASVVLHSSDIPWSGPMVSARVGYVDEKYVLNPSLENLGEVSELDMVVSFVGKEKRFLAMEAEAHVLPEEVVIGAINHVRDNIDPVLKLITDFAEEVNPGNKKYEFTSKLPAKEVMDDVSEMAKEKIVKMIESGTEKEEMQEKENELLEEIFAKFEGKYKKVDMATAFTKLRKDAIKHLVLDKGKRIDGRKMDEVRELSGKVGVLPRVHGSSLFQRGLTQSMTIGTLGSLELEQTIQDMYGERKKRYMHFYDFPPFSTGETGRVGGYAGGREIGHGMLAEKALVPVLPDRQEFPYTIILHSEILSSNGSSSMAATCASTLTLMDAGVPIKDMVGGIALGLVVNDDFSKYEILTDIMGVEDGSGYMDFKMTGTRDGVTAIQVDIKAKGLPIEMVPEIFKKSHDARIQILDFMQTVIDKPRDSVSEYAPKTTSTKVKEDQIGLIIGGGGKTIKKIQEDTQTTVAIEDDGSISISGDLEENVLKAKEIIEGMTKEVKAGEEYEGEVEDLAPYGAFVEFLPGKTGLLHVSEFSDEYVSDPENFLKVGETVKVKVLEVSRDGKYSLSAKAIDGKGIERKSGSPSKPNSKPNNRNNSGGSRGGSRGGRENNRNRGNSRGSRSGRGGDRNKRSMPNYETYDDNKWS